MILGRGVDVNAQGGRFGSAIQAASFHGHQRIVQLLLDSGADINAQRGSFGNPLWAASYVGCHKTVQLLLDLGADINAQSGAEHIALRCASIRGHQEIVKLLIDRGADVNAQHGSALRAILARQVLLTELTPHWNIIGQLLDRGADVTVKNHMDETPLHITYSNFHIPTHMRKLLGKFLVEKGADLTAPDKHGWTPLHCASLYCGMNVIKGFLEISEGMKPTGEVGSTPLRAVPPNYDVDVLRRANAEDQGEDASQHAELDQTIRLIRPSSYLLLDLPDKTGRTPLFYAAKKGDHRVVEMALHDSNALNRKDFYGITPLLAAARKGHTAVVTLLLSNKATEVHSRDCLGRTPLW
ncbi:ankyrin repeat protein [Colletotrichum plurivorum]|uniref:Ankyrin repeat protein n=1 Tax=Colletotrichum plurivorum TaxID=2175906 RepID=A0A8H6JKN8_9PEZI|nr:ankyrin repeat protein [Colletotrichum plurivorum]